MIILDALIEFVAFMIECAFYLCRFSDQSRQVSLLDRSPQERCARRRMLGLGCVIMFFLLGIAIAILAVAK